MKHAFLIAALLLAACAQTADQTIPPPADTPPEDGPGGMPALNPENGINDPSGDLPAPTDGSTTVEPGYGQEGTHSLCEDGECRKLFGCPEGYDEFMSQIGPACVRSYGQDEMRTWPLCERSSESCSCTYVSRDTAGNQLTWDTLDEGLRCAPENYRDYMVHGGLSGVDETGGEYAMIA